MARGQKAQLRRRERRALARRQAMFAAASGSTSLSLSDRTAAWDASAAKRSLSPGQFGDAHFWRDSSKPTDQITSYKLGFAKNSPPLTAVWRGVTAAAGAVQGARGGVSIPAGDVAGVKAKINSYYSKAAKKYDDPGIKPPWKAGEDESAADLLAYAETGAREGDEYQSRLAHWQVELGEASVEDAVALVAASVLGPASTDAEVIESLAAEALGIEDDPDEFQHHTVCECKHSLKEHSGADGPCRHTDGRGVCSCMGYKEMMSAEQETPLYALVRTIALGFEKRPYHDEDWPHGLTCPDCAKELAEGDEYVVIPAAENGSGPIAVGIVVCAECAAKEEKETAAPAPNAKCQCGHPAQMHDGDSMTGACTANGCDCTGFELAQPSEASVSAAAVDAPVGIQPPEPVPAGRAWRATLCPEGTPTDDGRMFAKNSIKWRDEPLTLMAQTETQEGHDGAKVAGRIDRIWREGNLILAEGVFDEGEVGQNVARMVDEKVLRGISVDIAVKAAEVVPVDENGNPVEGEVDPVDALFGGPAMFIVTEGIIGAVTVCPFPAFAEATISLTASADGQRTVTYTGLMNPGELPPPEAVAASADKVVLTPEMLSAAAETFRLVDPLVPSFTSASLTAAAAGLVPEKPPAEWFTDPQLNEATPLVVTPEGRVYGHVAPWDTCHIGIPGVCQTAPRSNTDYSYFHLKEVECDDGTLIPVGTFTIEAPHAPSHLSRPAASAHYDHTGTAVADIVVGEDEHGIWFSGALRDTVSEVTVRKLRGAVPSGDWRIVKGNLEMVAVLAVNVPGFPIPRPHGEVALAASGELILTSLIAAGIDTWRQPDEKDDDQDADEVAEEAETFAAVLEAARKPL